MFFHIYYKEKVAAVNCYKGYPTVITQKNLSFLEVKTSQS
jgi:hypothetical protein